MKHLHEYQQRVVDEKIALDEKIVRLEQFIISERFENLSEDEQARMKRQLTHMRGYSEALGDRIVRF